MLYLLYNLLLWLALIPGAPAWVLLLLLRKKWRAGIRERLGFVPSRLRLAENEMPFVWVHAVSVGEVLAAAALIRELQREHQVFISTTTLTGQTLARSRFGAERVFYFPLDIPFAIRAYLRRLRPSTVILLETEFWPNFLRLAHRFAKVAVVNARISDRSLPGYSRWRGAVAALLKNVDLFLAQSPQDAQRLIQIGAEEARVQVGGNLKFDWTPPEEPALIEPMKRALAEAQSFPVIVAGSTVEGEEPPLLRAFATVLATYPNALLVLAPRHPERFAAAAEICVSLGFATQRRSHWAVNKPLSPGVFLLDTIGELASVYQLADIAFVGGSLVSRGGHNILEPAYFGRPISVGPYTENFRDIVKVFRDAHALMVCNEKQLGQRWIELAANADKRMRLGQSALTVMQENTGATIRTLDALKKLEARK